MGQYTYNLAVSEASRSNLLHLNPEEIVLDESSNGRRFAVSDEAVARMADSLQRYGQRQPVQVRRLPDKRPALVLGYTRLKAALLLRRSGRVPDFALQATVSDCNEQEAFVRNCIENAHRNDTSVIDAAHNARRLREDYGKGDDEIAAILGASRDRLAAYRKLTLLPDAVQRRVHDGDLSCEAALALCDAPGGDIAGVLAEADALAPPPAPEAEAETPADPAPADDADADAEDAGPAVPPAPKARKKAPRVQKQHVAAVLRRRAAEAPADAPASKFARRSLAEVKRFLDGQASRSENLTAAALCNQFLAFVAGRVDEEAMAAALANACRPAHEMLAAAEGEFEPEEAVA